MAIVTFWSNKKEETAKTASIVATSVITAIDNNLKILLASTSNKDSSLETCFWPANKLKETVDKIAGSKNANVLGSGIDALVQLLNSNKLTPEIIPNYTKMIFKNRLEVLFGSSLEDPEDLSKNIKSYKDVIAIANKYYDLVFVDLNKGLDEEMVNDILNISDLVVINISQSLPMIDDYIRFSMENIQFDVRKSIIVVGRYDSASKYNLKNIAKYIGTRQNIYAVPYNILFFEAMGDGAVQNFFLKHRKVHETNENFKFIQEVKKLSSYIISRFPL